MYNYFKFINKEKIYYNFEILKKFNKNVNYSKMILFYCVKSLKKKK